MSTKLKDADLNDIESEEEGFYEVEEILDKKKVGAKWKYHIKWVGYGFNQTTWEPMQNLKNVDYMIEEFEKNWQAPIKNKQGKKPPKRNSTKNQNHLSYSAVSDIIKENLQEQNQRQIFKSHENNSKIIDEELPHNNQMINKKRKFNKVDGEKDEDMNNASQEIKQMNYKNLSDNNIKSTPYLNSSAMMTDNSQLSERSLHSKEINPNVISSGNLKNDNKVPLSNLRNRLNEEAIIIGDDENYAQKIYGSFESKDVPIRLITARLVGSNNDVNCLVEWVPRDNGIKPSDSFISNKILREKCPNILLDFYESRLRFPGNSSKK